MEFEEQPTINYNLKRRSVNKMEGYEYIGSKLHVGEFYQCMSCGDEFIVREDSDFPNE